MALTEAEELEMLELEEAEASTPEVPVSRGVIPRALSLGKRVASGVVDVVAKPGVYISNEIQDPSAFTYGAQEGALLGGAGEVAGAEQSALDYLMSKGHNIAPKLIGQSPTQSSATLKAQGFTGDIGPTTSGEMYDKARVEQEAKIQQAQTESPVEFTGGMLVGGLTGAGATGGYGMGALTPKVAGALGATETGLIAAGKQGIVPLAKAIGTEAISAAPMGAAYGALSAKPGERLEGAGIGAAEGGLTAMAVKGAAEAVPLVAKQVGKITGKGLEWSTKAPEKFATSLQKKREVAYNAELEGKRITNPEFIKGNTETAEQLGMTGTEAMGREGTRASENITRRLLQNDSVLSEQVGISLAQATSEGKQVDLFSPEMRNGFEKFLGELNETSRDIIGKKELRYIQEKLETNATFTPKEAQDLKNVLYNASDLLRSDTRGDVRKFAGTTASFAKNIVDNLKLQIPEYGIASSRLSSYRGTLLEPILKGSGINEIEINGVKRSLDNLRYSDDLDKARGQIKDVVSGIIDDLHATGATRESQGLFSDLKSVFEKADKAEKILKDKGIIQKTIGEETGNQLPDIYKDIDKAAAKQQTVKDLHKQDILRPEGVKLSPAALFKQATMGASGFTSKAAIYSAALTGRLQRGIQQGMIPSQFQDTLTKLNDAMKSNDSIAKNALINTLMQNNTIRTYMDDLTKEEAE